MSETESGDTVAEPERLAESNPDRNQWPEEPEEVDEDTDSA